MGDADDTKYLRQYFLNTHMKIKPRYFDKLFNKKRYNKCIDICEVRSQVFHMVNSFEGVDIWIKLKSYRDVMNDIGKFLFYTIDEERMVNDLGLDALMTRLVNDRNELLTILKNVTEVDLSEISKIVRDEKLKKIGL
jgi:hypothetical protein